MNYDEEIGNILNWSDREVHVLLAVTRKKENEGVTANTKDIHHNIVRERDELEDGINHLRKICSGEDKSYRLYISVNSRDCLKAMFELKRKIDEVTQMMVNGNESGLVFSKKIDSKFRSTLMKEESRGSRNFLFDLDNTCEDDVKQFTSTIKKHTEILLIRETPNGHHVVTKPFNYTCNFSDIDVDLKNDGMLYLDDF